jgi:hypothetical protein
MIDTGHGRLGGGVCLENSRSIRRAARLLE